MGLEIQCGIILVKLGILRLCGQNQVIFYHSFNNGLVLLLSKFHGDFCCMRVRNAW